SNFDQVLAIKPETSLLTNISSTISQPETSSCQLQNKSMIPAQSLQKRSNFDNYSRVSDKYMPERPPDRYGINSERFIHANIMNPIPSTGQIMESLANDLYKKLIDKFSAKPVKSKKKIEPDSDEDLTDRMSKLSINQAIAKGIEAGVNAVLETKVELIELNKKLRTHINESGYLK
ncbi:15334_t:CDS:2, partial [Acaulospora morrowiae]